MKNIVTKSALAAVFFGLFALPAQAQLGDLSNILKGGTADANYLMGEYMSPFAEGFGASLNNGWIQSAQPHGFLPIPGFHVRVSANVSLIPADARSFSIDPSRLTDLEVTNGVTSSPTISGKKSATTAQFNLKDDPFNTPLFTMPKGIGVSFVPSPMIQAGIGLPKKTQLMVRYVPEQDLGKFGKLSLWGVGFQHEVLQYVPLAKRIPLLNVSVVGGYTTFNMTKPQEGAGQELDWTTTAWNANLIAGVTTPFIKILSVYGGFGIEQSTSTLKMTGTYNLPGGGTITDPVDLEIKGSNNVRLVAGLRVKLALLAFNAEYTQAAFSSYTVGIGLGFR